MLFDLSEVENRINYSFKNKNLLRQAFTHSSYSNEKHVLNNERLEFLGDSILNFVVAEIIYKRYPKLKEGDLTRIRAGIVSAKPISQAAEKLDLQEFMLLGQGEKKQENISYNITADLFESIIGAIYLDSNIVKATKFIKFALNSHLQQACKKDKLDSKSELSELCQKMYNTKVKYVTLNQKGSPHKPIFTVSAIINGIHYKSATAENKKTAEQLAAKNAIDKIKLGQKNKQKTNNNN